MRRWLLLLQFLVTILLLALVISRIDGEEVTGVLAQVSLSALGLIVGISFLVFGLAARRSQLLAGLPRGMGGLWKAYRFYLTSMFYNQFLPTSIGGDAVRIYLIQKEQGSIYSAGSSVVLERAVGLIFTLLLAVISGLYLSSQGSRQLMGVLYGLLIGVAAVTMLLFQPALTRFLARAQLDSRLGTLWLAANKFLQTLQQYRQQPKLLFRAGLLTLAYQIGDIIVIWMLGGLVNMNVSFVHYLLIIPIVYVVTMLPISINGLGVRESTMVYLFVNAGAEPAQALLLSLLFYGDRLIKGMVGGAVLVIRGGLEGLREESRQ